MIRELLLLASSLFSPQPAEDLDAAAILRRAAEVQKAGEVGGEVSDFHVKLYLQVRDAERGKMEFDVERKYKAPDRIWTHVEEKVLSGAVYEEGYDGKAAWRYDRNSGKLVRYEGPDFKTDRRKILQELDDMRQLLRFFFLERQIGELADLARLPDELNEKGDGQCHVVEGKGDLGEGEGGEVRVRAWVEPETFVLQGVRIEYLEQPGKSLCFRFSHHRLTPQGLFLPGSVRVYRDGEEDWSERIALATEEGEDGEDRNSIRFNVGLADDLFAPPEK
ncbi:MAG: hypothetical protein HY812_05835 [Planctomycetes bacterium]|nr:hypothetical protein [Planctomycetota bacterium]